MSSINELKAKPVTISEATTPTLARWIEIGVDEDDNALNGYIHGLKDRISELTLVEDEYAPRPGEEASEQYLAINQSCRHMALLLSDLKAIRAEIHRARR